MSCDKKKANMIYKLNDLQIKFWKACFKYDFILYVFIKAM